MAPPEAIMPRNGSPIEGPDEATRVPSVSTLAMIFSGPRTTCSRPSSADPEQPPADAQPEPMHAAALADQGRTDRDERDGHEVAAHPGEPSDDGLDTAAERAGQVEVDGQAEQYTDSDEADPGKLVLAALDGLAKFCRGLPTSRRGRCRCRCRRLGRRPLGRGRRLRPFLGWPHVVIEVPTVPRGRCHNGALSGLDGLHRSVGADDDHQLPALLRGHGDAVSHRAIGACLDDEHVGAATSAARSRCGSTPCPGRN